MTRRTWNGHAIPDEAELPVLARMLDEAAPGPWLALMALAERSDPAALTLILEQCRSADPHRRRAAIEAIGRSPLGPQALEHARRALDDPEPSVIEAAIIALGHLHDETNRPRLKELLRASSPRYRGAALAALRGMWSDADFDAVLEVAQNDPERRNRSDASFLLREHPVRWRRLVALWSDSDLPRERAWVCELVGQHGDASDRQLLERLRRDADGHVRERAEKALLAVTEREG